jgi:SAM-dependent methyltransferase
LAQRGYVSYGVDGSIEGLRHCQRKSIDNGLEVTLFVADLEHLSLPVNRFDVIVVMRYLDRERIPLLKRILKPNGLLVFKTFNHNFLKEKPSFPRAYVLDVGELKAWFKNWRCVDTNDSADNAESCTHWLGYRTL